MIIENKKVLNEKLNYISCLSDIKEGFTIEFEDGDQFILLGDHFTDKQQYFSKENYNDDLTHKRHSDMDIYKVYVPIQIEIRKAKK